MTFSLTGRFLRASLIGGMLVAARPGASIAAPATPNQTLLDLMAEGKTETDLGHYGAAIEALTAIVDAPDAPPALRAEALVRLGVARRGSGDFEGALQAFERASKAPGTDSATKALLVQALGGALPGAERWAEVWPAVSFRLDRSEPKRPTLSIIWPDVGETKHYKGQPITLRIEQAELQELFRQIADITGLNVVVFPGVHGRVTAKFEQMPWDRVLDYMLAANGFAYQWEDNVLLVARPQQLPSPRQYTGQRIDVDWGTGGRSPGRDLRDALAELAAAGKATAVIDPEVRGDVVLKLNQVRWDQALGIVARVNGLDWTREGDTLKVFPRTGSAEAR
jgi:tetratricopeptide (TPR) repeat protein